MYFQGFVLSPGREVRGRRKQVSQFTWGRDIGEICSAFIDSQAMVYTLIHREDVLVLILILNLDLTLLKRYEKFWLLIAVS